MRGLMLTATALIAMAGISPAGAQHGGTLPNQTADTADFGAPPEVDGPDTTEAAALTGDARAIYNSWPADRQRTYDAWPAEHRFYFWKLNPTQRDIWFRLTDAQKATVFGLTPGQRLAAWQVIESRMGASAPAPAASRR